MSDDYAEETIFTVNGYAVTQSYIDNQKMAAQYQGIKLNDEEVYNKIIGNILLAQEAENRGFIVTEEEAKKFAQQMKNNITDNADNPEGSY
ncbi:MAG: hypothetical protein Q4B48_08615 [Syntrophomonadaceae bacterium]|nr:hypothetical protein [Syntrophomonadaceae bacterium]